MSEARPLRVGIVGCGFFAPNHVHAWAKIPGVAIAGLCDAKIERAHEMAKPVGIAVPVFADIGKMIDEIAPDFLDLVTAPETHPELVHFAASRKMPAIIQKPMALEFEAARGMVAAMEKAKLPFMVHENFRFQAPIAKVSEIVRSGEIGAPKFATVSFRTAHDIFTGQPYLAKLKRLILADVGVHVLDLARFLLGEAVRIHCETQSINPKVAGEDSATSVVRHASGAVSVVDCSYASPLPEELFPQCLVSVEGSEGSVVLEADYKIAVRGRNGTRRFDAEPAMLPWASRPWHVVQDSVLRCQEDWVASFRTGRDSQTSGRDNLATLALVEAAYRSAASGTSVDPASVTKP